MIAESIPLPTDPSTIALVLLVLVTLLRELWAWAKKKAEKDEQAKEGAIAKLEAKIDVLSSEVRTNLRELTNAQSTQHSDLAVALQRITALELAVAKLTDVSIATKTSGIR